MRAQLAATAEAAHEQRCWDCSRAGGDCDDHDVPDGYPETGDDGKGAEALWNGQPVRIKDYFRRSGTQYAELRLESGETSDVPVSELAAPEGFNWSPADPEAVRGGATILENYRGDTNTQRAQEAITDLAAYCDANNIDFDALVAAARPQPEPLLSDADWEETYAAERNQIGDIDECFDLDLPTGINEFRLTGIRSGSDSFDVDSTLNGHAVTIVSIPEWGIEIETPRAGPRPANINPYDDSARRHVDKHDPSAFATDVLGLDDNDADAFSDWLYVTVNETESFIGTRGTNAAPELIAGLNRRFNP